MKTSALSEQIKSATATQEIIRRLKNSSEHIPQEQINLIIKEYIEQLQRSGYNKSEVRKYVTAGIVGYERIASRCEAEGKPLHRPGATIKKSTYKKRLTIRTTWYKKSANKLNLEARAGTREGCQFKQPTAPIFIPRTPGEYWQQS